MTAVSALAERLRDLALVDLDTLLRDVEGPAAIELADAFIADLEDALGAARALLRDEGADLGAGPDPLGLVERSSEVRLRGGEPVLLEATERLAERAAIRRELATLEGLVRDVLPRLLQADRRRGNI